MPYKVNKVGSYSFYYKEHKGHWLVIRLHHSNFDVAVQSFYIYKTASDFDFDRRNGHRHREWTYGSFNNAASSIQEIIKNLVSQRLSIEGY